MSLINQPPSNPTEILSAQLRAQESLKRIASQTGVETRQQLETINQSGENLTGLLEMAYDQLADMRSHLDTIVTSAYVGLASALSWIIDYLVSSAFDDKPIWSFVTAEEYGLGLGANELIFIVLVRLIIGFGVGFLATYTVISTIRQAVKLVTKLLKK